MTLIIKIMAENCNIIMKFFFDLVDHGAFAGPCAPGNPDYNYVLHFFLCILFVTVFTTVFITVSGLSFPAALRPVRSAVLYLCLPQ